MLSSHLKQAEIETLLQFGNEFIDSFAVSSPELEEKLESANVNSELKAFILKCANAKAKAFDVKKALEEVSLPFPSTSAEELKKLLRVNVPFARFFILDMAKIVDFAIADFKNMPASEGAFPAFIIASVVPYVTSHIEEFVKYDENTFSLLSLCFPNESFKVKLDMINVVITDDKALNSSSELFNLVSQRFEQISKSQKAVKGPFGNNLAKATRYFNYISPIWNRMAAAVSLRTSAIRTPTLAELSGGAATDDLSVVRAFCGDYSAVGAEEQESQNGVELGLISNFNAFAELPASRKRQVAHYLLRTKPQFNNIMLRSAKTILAAFDSKAINAQNFLRESKSVRAFSPFGYNAENEATIEAETCDFMNKLSAQYDSWNKPYSKSSRPTVSQAVSFVSNNFIPMLNQFKQRCQLKFGASRATNYFNKFANSNSFSFLAEDEPADADSFTMEGGKRRKRKAEPESTEPLPSSSVSSVPVPASAPSFDTEYSSSLPLQRIITNAESDFTMIDDETPDDADFESRMDGGKDAPTSSSTLFDSLVNGQRRYNEAFVDAYRSLIKAVQGVTVDTSNISTVAVQSVCQAIQNIAIKAPETSVYISGYYGSKNYNRIYAAALRETIKSIDDSPVRGAFGHVRTCLQRLVSLQDRTNEHVREVRIKFLKSSKRASELIVLRADKVKQPCDLSMEEIVALDDALNRIYVSANNSGSKSSTRSNKEQISEYLAHIDNRAESIKDFYQSKMFYVRTSALEQGVFATAAAQSILQNVLQVKRDCMLYINKVVEPALARFRADLSTRPALSEKQIANIEKAAILFHYTESNEEWERLSKELTEILKVKSPNVSECFKLVKDLKKLFIASHFVDFIKTLYTEFQIFPSSFDWREFADNIGTLAAISSINITQAFREDSTGEILSLGNAVTKVVKGFIRYDPWKATSSDKLPETELRKKLSAISGLGSFGGRADMDAIVDNDTEVVDFVESELKELESALQFVFLSSPPSKIVFPCDQGSVSIANLVNPVLLAVVDSAFEKQRPAWLKVNNNKIRFLKLYSLFIQHKVLSTSPIEASSKGVNNVDKIVFEALNKKLADGGTFDDKATANAFITELLYTLSYAGIDTAIARDVLNVSYGVGGAGAGVGGAGGDGVAANGNIDGTRCYGSLVDAPAARIKFKTNAADTVADGLCMLCNVLLEGRILTLAVATELLDHGGAGGVTLKVGAPNARANSLDTIDKLKDTVARMLEFIRNKNGSSVFSFNVTPSSGVTSINQAFRFTPAGTLSVDVMNTPNGLVNNSLEANIISNVFDALLANVLAVIDDFWAIRYTGNMSLPLNLSAALRGGGTRMRALHGGELDDSSSASESEFAGGSLFDTFKLDIALTANIIPEATPFYLCGFIVAEYYCKQYGVDNKRSASNDFLDQTTMKMRLKANKLSPISPIFDAFIVENTVSNVEALSFQQIKNCVAVFNEIWNQTSGNAAAKLVQSMDILMSEFNASFIFSSKSQLDIIESTGSISSLQKAEVAENMDDIITEMQRAVSSSFAGALVDPKTQTQFFETTLADAYKKMVAEPSNSRFALLKQLISSQSSSLDNRRNFFKFMDLAVTPLLVCGYAYQEIFNLFSTDNAKLRLEKTATDQIDLRGHKLFENEYTFKYVDKSTNGVLGKELTFSTAAVDKVIDLVRSGKPEFAALLMENDVVRRYNRIMLTNALIDFHNTNEFHMPNFWNVMVPDTYPTEMSIKVKDESFSVNDRSSLLTLHQLYPYISSDTATYADFYANVVNEYLSDVQQCIQLIASYPGLSDVARKELSNAYTQAVDNFKATHKSASTGALQKAKAKSVSYIVPPAYSLNSFIPEYQFDGNTFIIPSVTISSKGDLGFAGVDGLSSVYVSCDADKSTRIMRYDWYDWVIYRLAACDKFGFCIPSRLVDILNEVGIGDYTRSALITGKKDKSASTISYVKYSSTEYFNTVTQNILLRSGTSRNKETSDFASMNSSWRASLVYTCPYVINKLLAARNAMDRRTLGKYGGNAHNILNTLINAVTAFYNEIINFTPYVEFMSEITSTSISENAHILGETINFIAEHDANDMTSQDFIRMGWANKYFFNNVPNLSFPEYKSKKPFDGIEAYHKDKLNGLFAVAYSNAKGIMARLSWSTLIAKAHESVENVSLYRHTDEQIVRCINILSECDKNIIDQFINNLITTSPSISETEMTGGSVSGSATYGNISAKSNIGIVKNLINGIFSIEQTSAQRIETEEGRLRTSKASMYPIISTYTALQVKEANENLAVANGEQDEIAREINATRADYFEKCLEFQMCRSDLGRNALRAIQSCENEMINSARRIRGTISSGSSENWSEKVYETSSVLIDCITKLKYTLSEIITANCQQFNQYITDSSHHDWLYGFTPLFESIIECYISCLSSMSILAEGDSLMATRIMLSPLYSGKLRHPFWHLPYYFSVAIDKNVLMRFRAIAMNNGIAAFPADQGGVFNNLIKREFNPRNDTHGAGAAIANRVVTDVKVDPTYNPANVDGADVNDRVAAVAGLLKTPTFMPSNKDVIDANVNLPYANMAALANLHGIYYHVHPTVDNNPNFFPMPLSYQFGGYAVNALKEIAANPAYESNTIKPRDLVEIKNKQGAYLTFLAAWIKTVIPISYRLMMNDPNIAKHLMKANALLNLTLSFTDYNNAYKSIVGGFGGVDTKYNAALTKDTFQNYSNITKSLAGLESGEYSLQGGNNSTPAFSNISYTRLRDLLGNSLVNGIRRWQHAPMVRGENRLRAVYAGNSAAYNDAGVYNFNDANGEHTGPRTYKNDDNEANTAKYVYCGHVASQHLSPPNEFYGNYGIDYVWNLSKLLDDDQMYKERALEMYDMAYALPPVKGATDAAGITFAQWVLGTNENIAGAVYEIDAKNYKNFMEKTGFVGLLNGKELFGKLTFKDAGGGDVTAIRSLVSVKNAEKQQHNRDAENAFGGYKENGKTIGGKLLSGFMTNNRFGQVSAIYNNNCLKYAANLDNGSPSAILDYFNLQDTVNTLLDYSSVASHAYRNKIAPTEDNEENNSGSNMSNWLAGNYKALDAYLDVDKLTKAIIGSAYATRLALNALPAKHNAAGSARNKHIPGALAVNDLKSNGAVAKEIAFSISAANLDIGGGATIDNKIGKEFKRTSGLRTVSDPNSIFGQHTINNLLKLDVNANTSLSLLSVLDLMSMISGINGDYEGVDNISGDIQQYFVPYNRSKDGRSLDDIRNFRDNSHGRDSIFYSSTLRELSAELYDMQYFLSYFNNDTIKNYYSKVYSVLDAALGLESSARRIQFDKTNGYRLSGSKLSSPQNNDVQALHLNETFGIPYFNRRCDGANPANTIDPDPLKILIVNDTPHKMISIANGTAIETNNVTTYAELADWEGGDAIPDSAAADNKFYRTRRNPTILWELLGNGVRSHFNTNNASLAGGIEIYGADQDVKLTKMIRSQTGEALTLRDAMTNLLALDVGKRVTKDHLKVGLDEGAGAADGAPLGYGMLDLYSPSYNRFALISHGYNRLHGELHPAFGGNYVFTQPYRDLSGSSWCMSSYEDVTPTRGDYLYNLIHTSGIYLDTSPNTSFAANEFAIPTETAEADVANAHCDISAFALVKQPARGHKLRYNSYDEFANAISKLMEDLDTDFQSATSNALTPLSLLMQSALVTSTESGDTAEHKASRKVIAGSLALPVGNEQFDIASGENSIISSITQKSDILEAASRNTSSQLPRQVIADLKRKLYRALHLVCSNVIKYEQELKSLIAARKNIPGTVKNNDVETALSTEHSALTAFINKTKDWDKVIKKNIDTSGTRSAMYAYNRHPVNTEYCSMQLLNKIDLRYFVTIWMMPYLFPTRFTDNKEVYGSVALRETNDNTVKYNQLLGGDTSIVPPSELPYAVARGIARHYGTRARYVNADKLPSAGAARTPIYSTTEAEYQYPSTAAYAADIARLYSDKETEWNEGVRIASTKGRFIINPEYRSNIVLAGGYSLNTTSRTYYDSVNFSGYAPVRKPEPRKIKIINRNFLLGAGFASIPAIVQHIYSPQKDIYNATLINLSLQEPAPVIIGFDKADRIACLSMISATRRLTPTEGVPANGHYLQIAAVAGANAKAEFVTAMSHLEATERMPEDRIGNGNLPGVPPVPIAFGAAHAPVNVNPANDDNVLARAEMVRLIVMAYRDSSDGVAIGAPFGGDGSFTPQPTSIMAYFETNPSFGEVREAFPDSETDYRFAEVISSGYNNGAIIKDSKLKNKSVLLRNTITEEIITQTFIKLYSTLDKGLNSSKLRWKNRGFDVTSSSNTDIVRFVEPSNYVTSGQISGLTINEKMQNAYLFNGSIGREMYDTLFTSLDDNQLDNERMFGIILNYFHKNSISFNSIYNQICFPGIIYGSCLFNTAIENYANKFAVMEQASGSKSALFNSLYKILSRVKTNEYLSESNKVFISEDPAEYNKDLVSTSYDKLRDALDSAVDANRVDLSKLFKSPSISAEFIDQLYILLQKDGVTSLRYSNMMRILRRCNVSITLVCLLLSAMKKTTVYNSKEDRNVVLHGNDLSEPFQSK